MATFSIWMKENQPAKMEKKCAEEETMKMLCHRSQGKNDVSKDLVQLWTLHMYQVKKKERKSEKTTLKGWICNMDYIDYTIYVGTYL